MLQVQGIAYPLHDRGQFDHHQTLELHLPFPFPSLPLFFFFSPDQPFSPVRPLFSTLSIFFIKYIFKVLSIFGGLH
jgi:hypothetical protein